MSPLELEAQVARQRSRAEDLQQRVGLLIAELARVTAARADAEETASHLERDCARLRGRVDELQSHLRVAAAKPHAAPAAAGNPAAVPPGAATPQPVPAGARPVPAGARSQPDQTRARPRQAPAGARPPHTTPTPRPQPPARPRPQSHSLGSYLERAEEAYERLVPSDGVVWLVVLVVCLSVAILVLIGAISL